MKKTAIQSPNYPEGGKNRPVVEMLLPLRVFYIFGALFLPVVRENKQILQLVKITSEEYAKTLGIRGGLIEEVVV